MNPNRPKRKAALRPWLVSSALLASLFLGLRSLPESIAQPDPPATPTPSATPGKKGKAKPLKRTKNAREIRSLVRSLGDPKWEVREAARDRLFQLGQEAVPQLERAARGADAERVAAATELLRALRWKVSAGLRQVVGEALDDFPSLGEQERLAALAAFRQRPHEARAVGVPFLLNVARFDPSASVRQGAVYVYLEVSTPSLPEFDSRFLVALADEKESDGRVNLMRAQLLARSKKLSEAILAAEIAVQKAPGRRESTLLLIELLLRAERFEDALPLVLQAESVATGDVEISILAGEVLVRAGKVEQGLAKLEAVAKDPRIATNLKILLRLGRSYLNCDRADDALKVYAEARKRFPLQYELNVATAEVLYAKGQVDDALKVYLSEIRYAAVGSGRYLELTTRLAKILKEGGAEWLTEETAFFEDAQRGRRVIDARRVVAAWLLRRGLAEEAEQEARVVTTLARTEARSWILLGDALRGQGKLSEARKAYEQAKVLAPKAPIVATRLARLSKSRPKVAGEAASGFAFWDQRIPVRGTEAVSALVPPPVILGDHVAVPAAGLIDIYGLEAKGGRLAWRFAPPPPTPEEGAKAEQYGLEVVSLVPVAPGVVAAIDPARAMDRRPLLCVLYNLYWRPLHRSWRKARFKGLVGYVVDPLTGKTLIELELDQLAQVIPPFPVSRGGRVLACGSPRNRNLELELVDLIRQETLWRASVPKSVRRPLLAGSQILLGFDGGVLSIDGAGEKLWAHQRDVEGPIATTNLSAGAGRCFYGTADGKLIGLSLKDGKVAQETKVGKRLTGVAIGAGRVFAAERGGRIHGLPLTGAGTASGTAGTASVSSWTQEGTRAASRSLVFAGGKLFALNGSDDTFRDEVPLLVAYSPNTGQILLQRPVSTPATLAHDDRLVVIASGGANAAGGLRVIGASPRQAVGAASLRASELQSAAADALAEGQFEVAAIVARKLLRRLGSLDTLSDETVEFLARILAKSKRPVEALDLIHYAEERAEIAGAAHERWLKLSLELKLESPPEEAPPPDKMPKETPAPTPGASPGPSGSPQPAGTPGPSPAATPAASPPPATPSPGG